MNKQVTNSRNKRFYASVVGVTFAVFLIILGLSITATYFSNRKSYANTLRTHAEYQISHISENINSYGTQTVYLRNNSDIINLISGDFSTYDEQLLLEKEIANNIWDSIGQLDVFVGVSLERIDGKFYLKNTRLEDFSKQTIQFIGDSKENFSDKKYDITICEYKNDSILIITSPVVDENQKTIGYIHVFLNHLVFGLQNESLEKEDYLFSTDNWRAIDCNKFTDKKTCDERVRSMGLSDLVKSSQEKNAIIKYRNTQGRHMMGLVCLSNEYPIALLTAADTIDMFNSIAPFTILQAGISLLLFAILIFIVNLLFNRTTKPVTNMIEQCSRLANGDDIVEIEANQDSDLDKLAKAFNSYRKKLEDAAYSDHMLNIGTRYKYIHDIDALITSKRADAFGIFIIDIKEFGKYNDVFSMDVGDEILCEVAKRLSVIFDKYLYRVNGDVFLGMLLRSDDYFEKAKEIHSIIKNKIEIGVFEFELQCRVSICCYPEHGNSAGSLLEKAQSALHQTKTKSLSDTVIYNDEMVQALKYENDILTLLMRRIADKTLEVWYQPIFHVASQQYKSAEALLRLKGQQGQYISPFEVILIAEKNHVVDLVGDYVLESTCKLLKKLEETENNIEYIQVNLSVQELARNNYATKALTLIRNMGVDPSRLGMEVTETMVIQSFSGAIETLNELRNNGIRIAMDDFGSGYSGINYLSKLPFDILKLDKDLVAQVDGSDEQFAFINTIVQLAKIKQIITVAEGVETNEILEKMRNCGVNCIQGYYFSKPLCQEKFLEFISQNRGQK